MVSFAIQETIVPTQQADIVAKIHDGQERGPALGEPVHGLVTGTLGVATGTGWKSQTIPGAMMRALTQVQGMPTPP